MSEILALASTRVAHVMWFDLGRYLIAAGMMALILLVFKRWANAKRIQNRHAKRQDYVREFSSSVRTSFVFALTTFVTLGLEHIGLVNLKIAEAGLATIAWQTVLIVMAHDAYFYWMHRGLHHRRLFKATHLHHHKSRTPTPWAAYSFSSWEAVTEALFVPLFLLLTSLAGITYAGFAVFLFLWHMIFRNVIGHLGVELYPKGWLDNPLTRWWNTTTHHDLHHSHGASNFGLYFTWWDRWMGTEHPHYVAEFRRVTEQSSKTSEGEPATA